MPTLVKVAPEIAATWTEAASRPPRQAKPNQGWVERPATLFISGRPRPLSEVPKVGDVLRLRAAEGTPAEHTTGVVLGTRVRSDGLWTHVELAVGGTTRWVSKSTIAETLGRVKGVSRIDQPQKQIRGRVHGATHSWFVRIYNGKLSGRTASFSDRTEGSKRAALKAALAFHTAHATIDASEGIPFL